MTSNSFKFTKFEAMKKESRPYNHDLTITLRSHVQYMSSPNSQYGHVISLYQVPFGKTLSSSVQHNQLTIPLQRIPPCQGIDVPITFANAFSILTARNMVT